MKHISKIFSISLLLSMSLIQSMDQVKTAAIGLTSCAASALSSGNVSTAVLSGLTDYTCANFAALLNWNDWRIKHEEAERLRIYNQALSCCFAVRHGIGKVPLPSHLFRINEQILVFYFNHFLSESDYYINMSDNLEDWNKNNLYRPARIALQYAVFHNRFTDVQSLLNNDDVDVNILDDYGNTPLQIACMRNHKDIIALLLEQESININCKNFQGNTVLHYAVGTANKDLMLMLLKKGIDQNSINNKGQKPMDLIPVNAGGKAVDATQQELLDIWNEFTQDEVLL